MKLGEDEIEARLDAWPVARLATVSPEGRPHQVPIVFARAGGELWSPVDGKPKSGRELARIRNVAEKPEVSLLLDEYSEDWSRLWWIRIDASARVVRPDLAERESGFMAARKALRSKYPQYAKIPLSGDPPTLLAFRVLRIESWRSR